MSRGIWLHKVACVQISRPGVGQPLCVFRDLPTLLESSDSDSLVHLLVDSCPWNRLSSHSYIMSSGLQQMLWMSSTPVPASQSRETSLPRTSILSLACSVSTHLPTHAPVHSSFGCGRPCCTRSAIQIVTLITHMQVCNILNGNQGFLSEPAVPPTPVRSLRDLLVRHSMQLYTVSSMDDRERRVCQSFACQCWNQCTTSRKDAASADTTVESSFPAMCRSSHVCSAHCSSGWMWPTLHQAGSSQMRFSG